MNKNNLSGMPTKEECCYRIIDTEDKVHYLLCKDILAGKYDWFTFSEWGVACNSIIDRNSKPIEVIARALKENTGIKSVRQIKKLPFAFTT